MNAQGRLPVAARDPLWVKGLVLGTVYLFLGMLLVVPLIFVFFAAFEQGWRVYVRALTDADALAALKLTLITVAIVVPLHIAGGVMAAWLLVKYEFRGKGLLNTLIDLPLAVSPVIVGLMCVLLFGVHGLLGPLLTHFHLQVIFALPGIVIATLFITFPYITREVVAVMEAQGSQEEEAALVMGANGWQIFWHVGLPKMRWGLLYGVILCTARALGEFGAVSIVSGHIRGATNSLPLHVEILYNEFQYAASFAVASLLTLLALVSLLLKRVVLKRFLQ